MADRDGYDPSEAGKSMGVPLPIDPGKLKIT